MSNLEKLKSINKKLKTLNDFKTMLATTDCTNSKGKVHIQSTDILICWQEFHGGNNYHSFNEESLGSLLNNAIQSNFSLLMKSMEENLISHRDEVIAAAKSEYLELFGEEIKD